MIRKALALSAAGAAIALAGCSTAYGESVASASAPPPVESEAATAALSAPQIEYARWTLDNGLQVIAIEDNSTANVTTSLWYEVGAKHDPEGRSGFSHLFEHILSRQTLNMPYGMINKLTEDVGGQRNASNWVDRTNYYETVPAQYLETMLWTHRERMAFPVVDATVFENERSVVKEELRQRVLAPPYGRLRFVTTENAYDVLPMRRPGIGSIEDLDSATLEDARAFHEAYYGPDTATLIVAGNFELAKLRTLVDTYFADIPPRANPVSLEIDGEEPVRTEPRSISATAPNVPLPVAGIIWKGPPRTHPDAAALEVAAAILSRGDNSRLDRALVRTGKAVNASFGASMFEDAGVASASATLSPGADMEEADAILSAEIARMRNELVSGAELREAKNELFSSALSSRQTARGRAFELGEALVRTGDPDAADKRLQEIAAVTAADVQRAAQAWLRPDGRVAYTYTAGEDDPSTYANSYPMPEFGSVPPATREPLAVRPEGEREAPPAASEAPEVVRADFVETTLANGIPLVSAQTSDVPIATITLVLPGGSSTDPAGKAGLAQAAANIADKGTPSRDVTEIAATLEALGASLGLGANGDGTTISLTAPTVNLAEAGKVMVDVLKNASYPQQEFELERKRGLDSLKAAYTNPGALARFVETRVMYGDAPYGQVTNPTSLNAITREDLIAHREAYWHPGLAKVVVSGGISSNDARTIADELLGDWTSDRAAPQQIGDPAGSATPPRTVVVDMPDAGQAAVRASVRALSRDDPDYYKLWLANTVLGSGSNGRLFQEVRTKRALSYGAYSSLGTSAGEATLTAQAQTKNETANEVAAVFFEQFELLGSEQMEEDALEKRRLFIGGAIARALETSNGFNGIVASLLLRGIEPEEAFAVARSLSNVSPEDVAAMATKYLDPDRASLVIVGDAQYFLDDLKAMRGDVEVIAFDELDLAASNLRKASEPSESGEAE